MTCKLSKSEKKKATLLLQEVTDLQGQFWEKLVDLENVVNRELSSKVDYAGIRVSDIMRGSADDK